MTSLSSQAAGPTYTDEQRAALETREAPVALGAGAGCGKTFILTERFLSHLRPADAGEPPAALDELVAITFTEAAAREMRERLRGKCRDRLAAAVNADEARFWRRLVRGLDAARVSTIHSFCGKLIRRHAIQLGIDPGFAVIDGAESGVRLAAAVDDALRERMAPAKGGVDERLVHAAATLSVGKLREALLKLSRVADTAAFAECVAAPPDELIARWQAFYRETVAPQVVAELAACAEWAELRELLGVAAPETPGLAEHLAALAAAMNEVEADDDAIAAIEQLTPLLKAKHANKDWPDVETKKRFTAVLKALRDRLEKAPRLAGEDELQPIAELSLEVAGIAADAAARYERDKRARAELDQDDLLKHARRLLTDPATADARREVAEGVRVLLVDEFQDTDGVQADIVRALVTPTDAEGDIAAAGGRLFFVGDDKQSIYRFRGAEPQVFRDLRGATPDAGRLELSQNFRSQPAVLAFVNELFAPLMGDGYVPLRAARPQATPGPAVELMWTPPPATPEGKRQPSADAKRRAEAATIAARVRALLDGDEPVVADPRTGEPRPTRPGDIALLFRALSDAALYEEALRDAGVDYYLVGGQAFYAQQEVYDLVNLLRSIDGRCDEVALIGALRSPWFGLPDEAIGWLARQGGPIGGLAAGVAARRCPPEAPAPMRELAQRACATLRDLRHAKDRVGAAELLRLAIEATGYDAAVRAEFLGERQLANLAKLHEQARAADAAGSGLRGFVTRLEEFVRNPPKEALAATTTDDAGVVRLMTVHASKGLEFPVVVLPDLDRKGRVDAPVAAFRPELGPVIRRPNDAEGAPIKLVEHVEKAADHAEQDRLFYVACTRAADRLILSACVDPAGKTAGVWLDRLARRFDLVTGEDAPGCRSPGGEPLVTVTPPPSPVTDHGKTSEGKKRGGLHDALEAARAPSAAKPLPATATPFTPQLAEFETFAVSRLSGKIGGDAIERAPAEADANGYDARRFGTLVHAVIERLDPAGGADIDELGAALAGEHLRRSVDEGAADAAALVTRFVESDTWAAMRQGEPLRRELEFLLPWTGSGAARPAMLRGYLDAAYRDATTGAWTIVDYKTNRVDAAGVPRAAEAYRLQLEIYAHAIEAITREPVDALRLHFLQPGVAFEQPWDNDTRKASIARIDAAIAEAREAAAAEAKRVADPLGELAWMNEAKTR